MSIESDVLRGQAQLLLDVADSLDGKSPATDEMRAARESALKRRDELRDAIADAESPRD